MKYLPIFLVLLFFQRTALLAQIPLKVSESQGLTRVAEPFSFGVPLAKGSVSNLNQLSISDPTGSFVPAQFEEMARWGDNSLRFVKVHFQADVSGNTTADYFLNFQPQNNFPTSLQVDDAVNEVTVNTGPLRFTIPKTGGFTLFDQVWLDTNEDGNFDANELIADQNPGGQATIDGVNFSTKNAAPDEVRIIEDGPLQTCIYATGAHLDDAGSPRMKYEAYIYAYHNKPYIRVYYVLADGYSVDENIGLTADADLGSTLSQYFVCLDLVGGGNYASFGIVGEIPYGQALTNDQVLKLRQNDRNAATTPLSADILLNGNVEQQFNKGQGWVCLANSEKAITMGSRYFWQKYPNGLVAGANGAIGAETVPTGTTETFFPGMGTGDEFLFYFSASNDQAEAILTVESQIREPLVGRAASSQYASSQAYYTLSEGIESDWPAYQEYVKNCKNGALTHSNNERVLLSPGLDLYGSSTGKFNFGDHPRELFDYAGTNLDYSVWGNNYYGGAALAALYFVQTGDRAYFDILVPKARHFLETASLNSFQETDAYYGFCVNYAVQHRSTFHVEQHYKGTLDYYLLTGDPRARDMLIRAAEATERQLWANENIGARNGFQRAEACLDAWIITRNPQYFNRALDIGIAKLFRTQDEFGLMGNYMLENPNVIGTEQTFMMALFSRFPWRLAQELEEDDPLREELIDRITRLADLFDAYARKAPGQESYWNWWENPPSDDAAPVVFQTSNPDGTVYWNGVCLIAGTYAFAYHLSGEEHYLNLARNTMDFLWNPGSGAFGMEMFNKASSQALSNLVFAVPILVGNPPTEVDDDLEQALPLQVYPNPLTAGDLEVVFPSGSPRQTLELFAADGKLVRKFGAEAGQEQLGINKNVFPSAGLYYLKSRNIKGKINVSKIIVR